MRRPSKTAGEDLTNTPGDEIFEYKRRRERTKERNGKKEIDWKYKALEKLGFGEESKKGGCERNME